MKTSATNRKIRILLTSIQNGELVPKPYFQRRLVWSNKHKLAFIKTVLQGYPFPEVYVAAGEVNNETGVGTEWLVDGQQRISTLFQYFKGAEELKLDRNTRPYRELGEDEKRDFLEYEVVIRDLGRMSIEDILEVFKRINSTNYALNPMEIHNARYDGDFKEFGDRLASMPFFENNRFFKNTEIKRMGDTRFCLTVVVSMMSGYFNRDEQLEKYLERYNEEFDERGKIESEFNATVEFISDCKFPNTSRVWNKGDLFSLLVEVHRALFKRKISLNLIETRNRLNDFYAAIDKVDLTKDVSESDEYDRIYARAALQASNDRGSRVRRGEIIQSKLDLEYAPQLKID
ncbi:DUF262 domain-containing protein [Hymenobacter sp. BT664]|uniref:DUF262 domain-containing protein n=1 Tax=Hymenobacter montanus TaxID=2771359 RepID=A0A927GIM7_9BACT|nr:DUF262 domain-containing protein [Hymenobacter montanus]MBD2767515.1 DUF262 domain-containing protein [Hymenobacter montanus]